MDDDIEFTISNWSTDTDDFGSPIGSGYTISFGPMTTYSPPNQKDMFTHYVQSSWYHDSHLSDEDPQWQVEAYIKQRPHLNDLQQTNRLHYAMGDGEGTIDYFFKGTVDDFLFWRVTWSEHLDDMQ